MPRESGDTIFIGGLDFEHGLITSLPKDALPLGASTICKNVDFARSKGRIIKRRGIQVDQAELAGNKAVSGLHQFIKTDGTKKNIASKDNNVYDVAAGVWTSKYAGAMAGAPCNFATFTNLLIFVSSTESTYKWDGVAGAFALLLGTPPANVKYVTVWQNRLWFANTSAGKSRLHFTADGNAEDSVTVGSAGFIDVNKDDGDEITGLAPSGKVMFVFKNRTVYMVTGNKPDNFSVQPAVMNRGCVSPRSIVQMGPFIVYLSTYGVHSISSTVDGFLSENIRFDIEALPSKSTACAGKLKDSYVLAYDSDADGKNDTAYILNLRDGSWGQWTNIKSNVFLTKDDGTLVSGGSEKTIIRLHDSGEDDEGSAITMQWRSNQNGFGDFTAMKTFLDVWFNAGPLAGKTLTVNTLLDGRQIDSFTIGLDAGVTGDDNKVIGRDGIGNGAIPVNGRFLDVEFINAETGAPVEITGISIKADVKPRVQTIT